MNRKDRAINLGLKIKSLEGNLSVAKSVIKELENEILTAAIESSDREGLLKLYNQVVSGLKELKSPSVILKDDINEKIESIFVEIRASKDYQALLKLEGRVNNLSDLIENQDLKKEHRAPLKKRIERINESYKKAIGHFLNKNFEMLKRDIRVKCSQENPFYVSIAIKELNKKVQTTPLFNRDRQTLQAILDTNWQKSSKDIKDLKKKDK